MLGRLVPTPAMAVALLALTVALGGSAYAVTTINGRSLANRSVPAVKIARNALGGVEINEVRLGRVPRASAALRADVATSAASATTAAVATSAVNAEKLGGLAPGAYALGAARVAQATLSLPANASEEPLLSVPGVGTVLASCASGSSSATLEFRNDSGGTLNLVGQSQGSSSSLSPNSPDSPDGSLRTLAAARATGISTVSAWSAERGLVATFVVANTLCRFSAQAIASR